MMDPKFVALLMNFDVSEAKRKREAKATDMLNGLLLVYILFLNKMYALLLAHLPAQ